MVSSERKKACFLNRSHQFTWDSSLVPSIYAIFYLQKFSYNISFPIHSFLSNYYHDTQSAIYLVNLKKLLWILVYDSQMYAWHGDSSHICASKIQSLTRFKINKLVYNNGRMRIIGLKISNSHKQRKNSLSSYAPY